MACSMMQMVQPTVSAKLAVIQQERGGHNAVPDPLGVGGEMVTGDRSIDVRLGACSGLG